MRAALPDDGRAVAVVTMPTAPSAIGPALAAAGPAYAALVTTEEALQRVSDAAVGKLTVMTPFLNSDGLSAVIGLFRRTRAPEKRLIIRRAGGARAAVQERREQLVDSAWRSSTTRYPRVPDLKPSTPRWRLQIKISLMSEARI